MKRESASPILALVTLLGVVLLFRGLEAYNAHLDALQNGPVVAVTPAAAASPRAAPKPVPTPTPIPTPSDEELSALASSDGATQAKAIETLEHRAMTRELASSIRAAKPANSFVANRLICLRARLPGRATIDEAIARLAKEDPTWAGDMHVTLCLLAALGDRIEEDRERIRDALIPFAMSYPLGPRDAALKGLARIHERELPPKLREQFGVSIQPSFPVRAAFAMGIDEHQPDLVREWLNDPESSVRSTVIGHLIRSPRPEAARQLARAVVESGADKRLLAALTAREKEHADATTALVEIALDEQGRMSERQRALELIATMGDTGAIPYVHRLRSSTNPEVKAYAESALSQLEDRLKRGSLPRMQPPRP